MPKPVIGITCERWSSSTQIPNTRVQGQIGHYVEAVLGAGGLPVLIPLGVRPDDLRQLDCLLDGVIIPGGGDIDPGEYQSEPHPATRLVDEERDRVELYLTRSALEGQKPIFGICRGIQVLNVAGGGTLYQDLPSEYAGALRHSFGYPDYPLDHRAHPVQVEEDSLLARALGLPLVEVNSRHHQAARAVPDGFRVVARAPDGVVEAVELPSHPFALGVQWHPENLQARPEMRALFQAFVAAAARQNHRESNH